MKSAQQLDAPAPRQRIHQRSITLQAFEREDGLFDIDAELIDARERETHNFAGKLMLKAGEPLHQMHLRLTLSTQFEIVAAQAATLHHPHEECPQITPNYAQLRGLTIGPGFNAKVKELFKGAQGCTHHTEVIGRVAMAAVQALWPVVGKRLLQQGQTAGNINIINTCWALRTGSPAHQGWEQAAAQGV